MLQIDHITVAADSLSAGVAYAEDALGVTIPVGGMFAQHGRAVQKFAITKTVDITEALLRRNGLTAREMRYFISHQANLRMLTSVVSRLGLHPEQHLYNVDSHGNQGAAGAPMVMSMHWERFAPGDLIVMAVVGAGLVVDPQDSSSRDYGRILRRLLEEPSFTTAAQAIAARHVEDDPAERVARIADRCEELLKRQ